MLTNTTQTTQRVLVADDDPVVRHLVTAIVKQEGYTPVAVNAGREAYRLLPRDADFKAAIFDMMMPHLEGLDIMRHLPTEKRLLRIPVMMITSEHSLSLIADSHADGATIVIPYSLTI